MSDEGRYRAARAAKNYQRYPLQTPFTDNVRMILLHVKIKYSCRAAVQPLKIETNGCLSFAPPPPQYYSACGLFLQTKDFTSGFFCMVVILCGDYFYPSSPIILLVNILEGDY